VTPQGMNYSLFLDVKRVTDGSATISSTTPRASAITQTENYVTTPIIPSRPSSSVHVSDALKFFEDHDEFYWNITGDEWDVRSARIGNHFTAC